MVREWGEFGRAQRDAGSALTIAREELPVLNARLLDDLEAQLGREAVASLIVEQMEDTRDRLKETARTLISGDLDTLRGLVHGLKSTTGSFGLTALSARAAAVERACREGQRAAALSLAGTLEGIARKSLDALTERYPESAREVA
jgi:HPt (histidine-containing phosphotransfer) domain-containing protein